MVVRKSNYFENVFEKNSSQAEIAGLKQQLDEERIQFSSYVDQISRLNGSKEELILEYESREQEMQQEIFSLQQQLQSKISIFCTVSI